jgi:restriction system protein
MSTEQKCTALRQLAKKRRRDSIQGYYRLSAFHGGYYECCFVSPWTKSAHNVEADVMLLGQDWSSSDSLNRQPCPEQRKRGQTWNLRTNVNLRDFLKQHMQLDFCETYATNVFPFIKKGPTDARIRPSDMQCCAEKYAVPEMEIVAPKMAICLGQSTFDAIRRSLHEERRSFADACAPEHCINHRGTEIYGVPHPGSWGIRNAGGMERVHERWRILAKRLMELRAKQA